MAEEIKKTETRTGGKETSSKLGQKKEREFIIPLRRKFIKTAEYRRAPKSIRAIKEFLVRHMKLYDRDLKKIKVDKYLNEFIWRRGIKNPPSKIKVKAVADGEFIRAELAELTEKLRFKKERLEKRDKMAAAVVPKVTSAVVPKEKVPEMPAEVPEKTGTHPGEAKSEEEKAEEKEKKAAVVEAGQKLEKDAAKKMKHQMKISKQPKRQRRMALEK